MGNYLPAEIITDILSRLLTESLLECSLVCKTWRNLIYNNDQLFAHKLSRLIYDQDSVDAVSSGKASFVYLCKSVEGPKHLKYMEYDDDNHEKLLKFGTTNLIRALDYHPVQIIGSCNGLICISGSSEEGESSICICNPITREFVYLPSEPRDYVVSGFGYSALTNEYKVVGIYWEEESRVGRVYVYTLGSGNGWRKLDITYDWKLHPSLLSNEILVNGALHWLDEDGDIVKFDLSDETFSVIKRPGCIEDSWGLQWDSPWDCELRVLGGCLRIIHRCGSRWYSIWSLLHDKEKNGKLDAEEEDYESSWSWEEKALEWGELYNNMDIMSVYPFAILKDNAKILYYTDMCYYDKKWYYYRQDFGGSHKLKEIGSYKSKEISDDHPTHDPVRYVKSFVSLKALGEEEAKIMESSEGGTKV